MKRLVAFGDSVTAGNGYLSGALNWVLGNGASYYPQLLAAKNNARLRNLAVGGSMVADQAPIIYANPLAADDVATLFFGVNDERRLAGDAGKLASFKAMLSACVYFLGQTVSEVGSAGWTQTGTWAPQAPNGLALGVKTTTPGSTQAATFDGDLLTFSYTMQDGYTGDMNVAVDGCGVADVSFAPPGAISTYGTGPSPSPTVFGPALGRIAGFGPGTHSVVFKAVSGNCYPNWLGQSVKPNAIHLLSCYKLAAYPYGGSSADVDALNAIVCAVAEQAAADGLNVTFTDAGAQIDPAMDINPVFANGVADLLHLNAQGHVNLISAIGAL